MQLRAPSVPVRWTIGIVLFVLILAWFTAPNPIAGRSDTDPFVGRWLVNGVDPFGTGYSGSLSIIPADPGYALEWIVTGALVSGTAQREDARLLAEWRRRVGDEVVTGSATYRIDDDGNLRGAVRVEGAPAVGTEVGEPAG